MNLKTLLQNKTSQRRRSQKQANVYANPKVVRTYSSGFIVILLLANRSCILRDSALGSEAITTIVVSSFLGCHSFRSVEIF